MTTEIARAESERGEVVLRQRPDGAVELRVNGVFVMDTLETGTERALSHTALSQVEHPRRVLVGGLGLGFTAHEVLGDARVEQVRVVEVEPAVVGWMRDGTAPHGPGFLADDRIEVVEGDVATVVAESPDAAYDLVLLDVDNGPDQLVHEPNAALYDVPFLAACRRVLADGGVLAVWSAAASEALRTALSAAYAEVEALRLPVDLQGREEAYWLYIARR